MERPLGRAAARPGHADAAGSGPTGSSSAYGDTDNAGQDNAGRDFTVEQVARGRALRRAQFPPALAGRLCALVLFVVLGVTPGGARLVGAFGGPWWAEVLWGAALVSVLECAVRLPFAARVRVVRRSFGLVTQGWAGWWLDVLRSLLVALVLAAAALLALYGLRHALPDTWWLAAAGAAAVASLVLSWLAPLLLEPMFNRFTPMPEGPLRAALLDLAQRDGISVREALIADASRRTTALNAYVSGYGATRRIVVYDTLLHTAPQREVELVVAHELGHVKHSDVLRGTVLAALGAALGMLLLAALLHWRALLAAAGADGSGDPRSLLLVVAAIAVLSALTGPMGCAVSRRVEARADLYCLELTGDPEGFIAMQRRLSVANVAEVDPPRLIHALFATHPSTVQRIAAARAFAAAGRPS